MAPDDRHPAPFIALARGGTTDAPRADALCAAWRDGPVLDLDTAERIWAANALAPDALVYLAGDAPDPSALARLERLRRHIRAAGVGVPLIVETHKGAKAGWLRLPDAFMLPQMTPETMAGRVRETLRQSVRMEEARLRRMALGPFPAEGPQATARTGGLMVAGMSQHAGAALAQAGVAVDLDGVLSPHTVCTRLNSAGSHALFIDLPLERALDVLQRVAADPRHVSLPVLAMATTADETDALCAAGCGDVVLRTADPADLGIRLRVLLAAGARRRLSTNALRRFRSIYLEEGALLPRARYDAYLARLTATLRTRGRAPLVRTLEDLHPAPLPARAANDDPLAPVVGDPVRSTILAASREEDFVARVDGHGDMIVLRDAQAAAGLMRRVGAIVASTSFV